jgi:uncharacterized membrane protein (DUF485 family)
MNNSTDNDAAFEAERKRRIRKSALWLALLAVAFYVGFIVLTASRT